MNQLQTKRNLRWTLIFLLIVPGICCSGCLTTLLISKNVAAVRLDEKLDDLSARGIPIGDGAVDKLHRESSSTEFASDWVTFYEIFKSPKFKVMAQALPAVGTGPEVPPIDQPWTEQAAVEAMLTEYRGTVDRLLELSQQNGPVTFPIKMDGFATLLPFAQDSRQLARILLLESHVAARVGDGEREYRAINGVLGCSISLRGQPFMVSQLVAIAIHRIAIQQLQSAVEADRLSTEQLKKLNERLDQFSDFQAIYQFSLKTEMGIGALACRNPDNMLSHSLPQWNVLLRQTGMADRAAYFYLEQMESAIDIEAKDLQEFSNKLEALEFTQSAAKQSTFALDTVIAQQALPAIDAFGGAIVEHTMINRLAQLGIAIRLYEKSHSVLPSRLEELETLGINLEKSKTSSGELPKYQVNPAGSVPRAVLWSFSTKDKDATGKPTSKISETLPNKPSNIGKQTDIPWWIWELK